MEGARRVPGWTPVDFLILRHGQTTWNARGIIQGQADAPLDDVGRAQARALAEFLAGDGDANLSARRKSGLTRPGLPVVTSDLSRAVDTARVLADALVRARARDDPTRLDPGDDRDPSDEPEPLVKTNKLRERHVGRLQGLARLDAKAADPEAWRAFRSREDSRRVPGEGGESYDDLWDRVVGFVEARAAAAAAAAAAAKPRGDGSLKKTPPIALVTHGGVARVLLDRCKRDEGALEAFFRGRAKELEHEPSQEREESLVKQTEPETRKGEGQTKKGTGALAGVRRRGVVPNCSVGVIRVHVPGRVVNDGGGNERERRRERGERVEQMWELLVWGEDSFLASAGGNAESAAGEDYA
jgi:probable phosphoglycerate mutase